MDSADLRTRISQLSVAVIGDICLDAYYFLREESGPVSIETGKRTRAVETYRFDGGGAANVALNLKSLGVGTVDLFGVVGEDSYALVLGSVLEQAGVSNRAVTQKTQWSTHVYNKFYSGGVEEPRVDIGNFNVAADGTIDLLLAALQSRLEAYDLVLLNQQVVESYQTVRFQQALNALVEQTRGKTLWFCDCRDLNDVYFSTIHKLNRDEGLRIYGAHHPDNPPIALSDLDLIGWLFSHWNNPVVLTDGDAGALVTDGKQTREVPGVHVIHQVDTVGAGDAFLAAFACAYTVGVSGHEATNLGNVAASVAVQKLFQTGHPTWDEVQAGLVSTDYRYHTELAAHPQLAKYLPGTEIELITKPVGEGPQVAIFDHDGTISTLRRGWEAIMEPMMVAAVVGDGPAPGAEPLAQIQAAVASLIARTTGVQTLLQMHALGKLVRDFGRVAEAQIRSPQEYKAIYNQELLNLIRERTVGVASGRLSVSDVTLKGSVEFLHRLHQAGVTLYLASGTDVNDVVAEATLLGYAHLFEGRIFGSVGNLDQDPKRLVFEQLLGDVSRARGLRCAVFGDGPVELREGKKFGATTIGLVSDERQRYGLNPAKRSRLVLAGADVLIPDFSWHRELTTYLGWNL
ncbi:MAG: PfkB family carbohydrate kinase [Spirochaetales bacterium]